MSSTNMVMVGTINPNWNGAPSAAQVALGPGAVFYDVAATTRAYYTVKPDLSGFQEWTGAGGGGTWGSITGTLSNQSDLSLQLLNRVSNPQQFTFNATTGLVSDQNSNTATVVAATIPVVNGVQVFSMKVTVGGTIALGNGVTSCRNGDLLFLGSDGAGGVQWNRGAGPGRSNANTLQMSDGIGGFLDAVADINYRQAPFFMNGLAFIHPPAGTFGANGVVTFTTGLVSAPNASGYYDQGAYWYIVANAINGTNPAGWYWGKASSQSQVTIYNNLYVPATNVASYVKPQPVANANLVPFVSSAQSAYTPLRGSMVPAIVLPLPLNPMGPHGRMCQFVEMRNSNGGSYAKQIVTRLGAVGSSTNMGMNSTATGNAFNSDFVTIKAQGTTNFTTAPTASDIVHGGLSQNGVETIDMTQQQYLTWGLQIATGGNDEWIAMTYTSLDIFYSN